MHGEVMTDASSNRRHMCWLADSRLQWDAAAAAAAAPPGHPQLIQQAQQGPAVVVAQGGLHLDLPDGVAGLLCVAQHVLDGALPQLSYQGLLQATPSVAAAARWLLNRQSHRLEDQACHVN